MDCRHGTTCDSDTWDGRSIADERAALRPYGADAHHRPFTTYTVGTLLQKAGKTLLRNACSARVTLVTRTVDFAAPKI